MTDRDEEIRTIAYRLWEQEGRAEGRAVDYWLRAESEWESRRRTSAIEARPTSYFRRRSSGAPSPARYRTERPF